MVEAAWHAVHASWPWSPTSVNPSEREAWSAVAPVQLVAEWQLRQVVGTPLPACSRW